MTKIKFEARAKAMAETGGYLKEVAKKHGLSDIDKKGLQDAGKFLEQEAQLMFEVHRRFVAKRSFSTK